jgi:hypothetical protein
MVVITVPVTWRMRDAGCRLSIGWTGEDAIAAKLEQERADDAAQNNQDVQGWPHARVLIVFSPRTGSDSGVIEYSQHEHGALSRIRGSYNRLII